MVSISRRQRQAARMAVAAARRAGRLRVKLFSASRRNPEATRAAKADTGTNSRPRARKRGGFRRPLRKLSR